MEGQRKILLVISKDVIRRNILDTDFWPLLVQANPAVHIILVVEAGKGDIYQKRFAGPNITVEEYERTNYTGRLARLMFFARSGIRSKSTTFHRWYAHAKGRATLSSTLVKSTLSLTLGMANPLKRLVRKRLLATQMPEAIERIFDAHSPDIVFAPSLVDNDFDVLFGIEAKRRGVRLIGMVRSWDNLNHHGLLAVIPDRFLFQNRWLVEAAKRFQAIATREIKKDIVGVAHYDLYCHPESHLKDRAAFFEEMGLDPEKKLLLVGGAEYYYSEDELPCRLEELIESGAIRGRVQVLFRPHPSSMYEIEDFKLEGLKHVVLDAGSRVGKTRSFSDTDAFINLLHYADVVINICSTLSIDASTFDTPAIALDYEDPKKGRAPYWEHIHRLNDFDHQAHLIQTGGVRTPRSPQELAENINAYLENPTLDKEGRKRIIEEFVAPFDGRTGARIASVLTEEIQK